MRGNLKIRGYTVAQFPNPPLWVALVALLAALLSGAGTLHDLAGALFYVALSVWAYEELARGVNGLRRSLGALALLLIVIALARAIG